MAEKLSEKQISAIISQQIELAKHHDAKGGRATSRAKALDYYFGNMDSYVPPETGRSKVVSRDVADAIGFILPQIMRIFTASGRMFVADPSEPEDLEYSDEVSDGLNYIFWKDNKGYEVVYAATWDSLVHGDAIVKTFWEDTPVYGPARYHDGLSEDELAMLAGDDAVEVLAKTERTVPGMDEMGMPVEAKAYDIKLRRKKADGRITITVLPPEEFLIDDAAICVEDAAFKAHWQRKTRSALVEMGYEKDVIWSIPEATRTDTPEEPARRAFAPTDTTDKSTQLVDYYECFPMIDADGDGVAEMLRVCYAGNKAGKLLDWEVWEDEDPFDSIPCEPIPHRLESRSITDEEVEVQDVKTVLSRQLLNNTYWINNPQRFARGKISNPELLDNPIFGSTIFGDVNSIIEPLPVPYIGDKALQGIHYMDEVSARRTGISNQTMALDPEVLQNQSATANQNAQDASRAQPELIARNMAEWGWSKVGRKILRLMTSHEVGPRAIMVRGKQVQIDPRNWNPDLHVTVNTGLGTGSRDRDAMMLGQVLQQQIAFTDRIGQTFPEKALDMLPYIHNTLTQFAESTGLRSPELYWPDIDPAEIEQGKQIMAQRAQQPDPAMMLEQMKQQGAKELAQVNAQVQLEIERGKNQLAAQQAELAAQGDVIKNKAELEADLQTKEADRQNALNLEQQQQAFEREKLQAEYAFKTAELQQKTDIETMKLVSQQMSAAQTAASASTGEGGDKQPKAKVPDFEAMVKALTAPKRIIRDSTGRAVGVEAMPGVSN